MALATRCPQCGASFRVVADQLKLRGGLVRCGDCRTVFDAIGTLSYLREDGPEPDGAAKSGGQAGAASDRATAQDTDERSNPPTLMFRESAPEPAAEVMAARPTQESQGASAGDHAPADPADSRAAEAAGEIHPDERSDVEPEADRAAPDEPTPATTPLFLREPGDGRARRWAWGGVAAVLASALAGQVLVVWHADLLARWPRLYPVAVAICQRLPCTPHWPMRAEQIAVVGSELQAVPNTGLLELNAVLRNRAAIRLQQPALELTLTDTRNRIILRRVFRPEDYAPATGERADGALPPGEDTAIRIHFEAPGVAPVGFVLYPFYL